MANLFNIEEKYLSIIAQLEDNDGELTPELETALTITHDELIEKIKSYYYVIKTKEAEIEVAKSEVERLKGAMTTRKNLIDRLKKVVDQAVELFGTPGKSEGKKLDLGDLKVWQKKTEALGLAEEAVIDDERFCLKEIKFALSYEEANELLNIIKNPILTSKEFIPNVNIVLIKDKLKTWLLQNEEEHKRLRTIIDERLSSPITNVEFENNNISVGEEVTEQELQDEKDIKVLMVSKINHNSTVIFR